jgi:hypothetical protein
MEKHTTEIEIPAGYIGETPKVYHENGKLKAIYIILKPINNGITDGDKYFDYQFGPRQDGSGYGFNRQSIKGRGYRGEMGDGIRLLFKGFFNIFGNKK